MTGVLPWHVPLVTVHARIAALSLAAITARLFGGKCDSYRWRRGWGGRKWRPAEAPPGDHEKEMYLAGNMSHSPPSMWSAALLFVQSSFVVHVCSVFFFSFLFSLTQAFGFRTETKASPCSVFDGLTASSCAGR